MQLDAGPENIEGPRMNPDRPIERLPVEATDVAVGLVETHQPMHRRDCFERGIDCTDDLGFNRPGGLDFDERPEQRSGAANAI